MLDARSAPETFAGSTGADRHPPAETGHPILPSPHHHEEDDFLPTSFGPSDYALIPLYGALYAISPMVAIAILSALQFWEVIHRTRSAR